MKTWEYIWKYALVFILIHMSSGASVIALSDAALAGCAVMTIAIAFYRKVIIDKHFYTFSLIFVALAFGYMMQFGWLNFTATARIYLKILYAYLTIKIIGWTFLNMTEDIIGKLAIISLPLFAIQYFLPQQMLVWNGFTEFIIPQVNKGGYDYSNSILFTVNPWGLERNSGFMWEPGGFAAMLSLGMFLNMTINSFKRNWKLVAMGIAMVTTFSTTGYLLLLILGIFWLINQKMVTIMVSIPVFVLTCAYVLSMPDVTQKIVDRYAEREKTIDGAEGYAESGRDGISIGRFGSFILDTQDLMNYPIIGYGLQQTERTNNRYIDLVRANGFSDYLVKFGILGIIFLTYSMTKTFYRLGSRYEGKGYFFGTIIVLVLSFSNPVLVNPIFFALQFYFIAIQFKDQEQTYVYDSSSYTYIQS